MILQCPLMCQTEESNLTVHKALHAHTRSRILLTAQPYFSKSKLIYEKIGTKIGKKLITTQGCTLRKFVSMLTLFSMTSHITRLIINGIVLRHPTNPPSSMSIPLSKSHMRAKTFSQVETMQIYSKNTCLRSSGFIFRLGMIKHHILALPKRTKTGLLLFFI